jgi:hypothetical protein
MSRGVKVTKNIVALDLGISSLKIIVGDIVKDKPTTFVQTALV